MTVIKLSEVNERSSTYEIKTYGVGAIYLEEGWHSIKDLKAQIDIMESRSKDLVKSMSRSIENAQESPPLRNQGQEKGQEYVFCLGDL